LPTCDERRFHVSRVLFRRASKTASRADVSRASETWDANFGLEPCVALFALFGLSLVRSWQLDTGADGVVTLHTYEGRHPTPWCISTNTQVQHSEHTLSPHFWQTIMCWKGVLGKLWIQKIGLVISSYIVYLRGGACFSQATNL
jgi:hypothetical protein